MPTQNHDSWKGNRPGGRCLPDRARVQPGSSSHSMGGGPRILLAAAVAVAVLLLSAVACAPTSPAPGSAPSPTPGLLRWTPAANQDPMQTQGEPGKAGEQASVPQLDCAGQDFLKKVRADYAANPVRAGWEYVGQRVCLKGKVSGFSGSERSISVKVDIGEGVWFYLRNRWDKGPGRTTDHEWAVAGMWKEWALSASVGDRIEVECEVEALKVPGTPALTDCQRVVGGVAWTPPTPTPIPTSTPFPCTVAKFGDGRAWLHIDCSAESVTVGAANVLGEFEGFQTLSAEGPVFVSFRFIYAGDRITDDADGSYWKQQATNPLGGSGQGLMWEAPPDVAAYIMSEWRHHDAKELGIYVNGECCSLNLDFDLTQPSAPAGTFWAATPAPQSSPTPTQAPPPSSTATPEPKPTTAPTPTPSLPSPAPPTDGPLAAQFIRVPEAHSGDAVQLWLFFSEAVTTSYKTLRDAAIQVENGAVAESKRVDGRSDLWRITVEPDGSTDLVVTLSAPPGCGGEVSVCAESGKALSNSPAALFHISGSAERMVKAVTAIDAIPLALLAD